MNCAAEKVPKMLAMKAQSPPVAKYHAVQSVVVPVGTGVGDVVTVGGIGRSAQSKAAAQYQYPGRRPAQSPLREGCQERNWASLTKV